MHLVSRRPLCLLSAAALAALAATVAVTHRTEAQVPLPPNPNQVAAELIRIVVRDYVVPSVTEFMARHSSQAIPDLKARMRELRNATDPRGWVNFLWTSKDTAVKQKQSEVFAATQMHLLPRDYTTSIEAIERRKIELGRGSQDGGANAKQKSREQLAGELVHDIGKLRTFLQDKLGIVIEQPDLQNLLSRVDGPESLKSLVSIVLLSQVVADLTKEAKEENFETSAFLHRALIDSIGRHQAKYDTDWLKQLATIEDELKAKMKRDEELTRDQSYKNATPDLKKFHQSIMGADKAKLASIAEYRRVLQAQKANLSKVLKEAEAATQIYKSAEESIRIAGKLSALMTESKVHYTTLRSIQRPLIVRFKDQEHRQRHEDISLRLAQIKK